jgi:hypothetical protein
MSLAAVSDECKTMDFLQQVADGYLRNHIIQSFSTETQSLCRVKCYLSNLCLSYNYNENNGTCDINDSDQIQHPDDLIVKAGFLHVSTEVIQGGYIPPFPLPNPPSRQATQAIVNEIIEKNIKKGQD